MSLWSRGPERKREIKRSDELCKRRDEVSKKWPAIMEAWNKEDEASVRKAATELSITLLMQNPTRLLEARESLKQTLWKRDAPREAYDRQITELNAEIEALNVPVIFEKASTWQADLSALRTKKIVEATERWSNPELGRRVRYKSNFAVIVVAKERLSSAIRELREMRTKSLTEVFEFIKTTELALQSIDFTLLGDETEVSEARFVEISAEPEVRVSTTGFFLSDAKGNTTISKNYDLPVKEFKTA
jgi:hypothetical protein